jgi:hypothetical protein
MGILMQKGTILLAVLLASGLPGCDSYSEHRLQQQVARTVRHNPNPQHSYRLTLTLHDAPGPFLKVRGVMQYTMENDKQCGFKAPITKIVVSWPNENIPFTLEKISDMEYTGIIHTDLLLDDNYYGRETCHWQFAEARALLQATGATEATKETIFIMHISSDLIATQGEEIIYYWKGNYPNVDINYYSNSGSSDLNRFRPEIRDQLFSITVSAKEVTP